MRLAIIFSTLLLNLFSNQQVNSATERDILVKEILAKFDKGQNEFNDLVKNGDLRRDLVLLMGSSKAMEDFFNRSSEIVNVTSNSEILPRLTLNTRTNSKFLDFFISDEEDESALFIPRIYFTKKIVSSVSEVKLLVLVDFPSFDKQIEALLRKAGEFMKNAKKFADSIGLVVTQVQNKQQIEEVKVRLKNLVNSPIQSAETEAIVDALCVIYKGGDDWSRLGFVFSSKANSLESREDLERMIYETMDFENHNGDDFVYRPCEESRRSICDSLIQVLYNKYDEGINRTAQNLIDSYVSVEKTLLDFDKTWFYLTRATELLLSFENRAREQKIYAPEEYTEKISEYLREATVDFSTVNFQLPTNYAKYLVFLRPGLTFYADNIPWHLRLVSEYLESSTQWYKFLLDLDNQILSGFQVQQDISPYKEVALKLIEDIERVKTENNNDITQSLNNLLNSLPRRIVCMEHHCQDLDNLKMNQLEEPKLEVLKKLLSATLMHNGVNEECDQKSKKLTISGPYVKISDVYKYKCDNANFIEVFALYRVFFDTTLNKSGKKVHLAIMAPYWDVSAAQRPIPDVNINGLDATGGPELPGGPAGNFLGIVRFARSWNKITIWAMGGKGGPARKNGMPGLYGKQGDVAIIGYTHSTGLSVRFCERRNETIWEGKEDVTKICPETKNTNMHPEGRKSPEILKPISFDRSINSYQCFLRENQVENSRSFLLKKWSDYLADNEAVLDLYDVMGLIDEFHGLEDQFWKLNPKMSLLPAYRSLLGHIINYTEKLKMSEQLSRDKKYVLRYLYTAAVSKIVNLENNVQANLVVDLEGFWKIITSEAKKLEDLRQMKSIKGYRKDYLHDLNGKIEEARRYVSDVVTREIDNTMHKLDNLVLELVNETVALQREAQKEKRDLIKKRESLKTSLILSGVFNGIKVASMFLNFLGPVGTAVGGIIGEVASVSDSLLTDTSGVDKNALLKLPNAISKSVGHVKKYIGDKQKLFKVQLDRAEELLKDLPDKEKSDPEVERLRSKIKDTKQELKKEMGKGNTYDPASVDKKNTLRKEIERLKLEKKNAKISDTKKIDSKIKEKIKELKLEEDKGKTYDPASVDRMHTLRKEIKDLASDSKKALQEKKPQRDAKVSKTLKAIGHIQNGMSFVEASVDVYQKISSQQNKIDEVGDLIQNTEQKFQQLKQYESKIYDTIIPVCKNIEANVNQLHEQLEGKSAAALVVSKWKIQGVLGDVKKEIKKMTTGFQVQDEFVDIFDKVEVGINVMIKLYDMIDEYSYRAELGAYIANINSHPSEVDVTKNNDLNDEVNKLMLVIQQNIAIQNYKIATDVVKQRVFPYAHDFFGSYNLPEALKVNRTDETGNAVSKELGALKNQLTLSDSTTNERDIYVHRTIFGGRNGTSKPFYTWKYNDHKSNIAKLLNGQEVVLKADIRHGFEGNAVKFNRIGIYFASANKTIEHKLNDLLRGSTVTLIHLGQSFYKCDDRIYMIPSANQTILLSLDQYVGCTDPTTTNSVYDKIAKNEPVLSPYATWQMKLNIPADRFDEVSEYAGEIIDLVLEGTGKYLVLNRPEVCNDQLDRYYARADYQTDGIQLSYEKTPERNLDGVIDYLINKYNCLHFVYSRTWYGLYQLWQRKSLNGNLTKNYQSERLHCPV
ncbi:hypothetical protein TKK_0004380 [Trichogramma kaykai]|uniref:Uncharacterized protein n=1 Tax=Trichogramma kaykai TaxID=54128 RepID=A0ABD2XL60_9HYME